MLVLDARGVGYEILATSDVLEAASAKRAQDPQAKVTVVTHLVVRDDAWMLYGFRTRGSRLIFRALLKVQSVGPKVALNVMSVYRDRQLLDILRVGDVALVQRVPGVGAKMAKRIVAEVPDHLAKVSSELAGVTSQDVGTSASVVNALEALGFGLEESRRMLAAALAELGPDASDEDALRVAIARGAP